MSESMLKSSDVESRGACRQGSAFEVKAELIQSARRRRMKRSSQTSWHSSERSTLCTFAFASGRM